MEFKFKNSAYPSRLSVLSGTRKQLENLNPFVENLGFSSLSDRSKTLSSLKNFLLTGIKYAQNE